VEQLTLERLRSHREGVGRVPHCEGTKETQAKRPAKPCRYKEGEDTPDKRDAITGVPLAGWMIHSLLCLLAVQACSDVLP
jgi:hypothetical protein